MRFMTLLKADGNSEAGVLPGSKLLEDMGQFTEELVIVRAGVLLAGEGARPPRSGHATRRK